jgi:4a-hydroxytetrahydrobiopterin dehydratase
MQVPERLTEALPETPRRAHSRVLCPVLSATQVISGLAKLSDWKLHGDGAQVAIEKNYTFKNYLCTIAFVNAIAYIAEQQDHHPELLVRYSSCSVRFNTHDVQGITQADFACAALVDALLPTPP